MESNWECEHCCCLAPHAALTIPLQIEFDSLSLSKSTISGGMDLHTSMTVFIKEFVPLEYCQKLSAGVQNKRTLTSFFSPGKTKKWKQATTLNGHPYMVSHLPRGVDSREVEFEGLLCSHNNLTRLISLGHDGTVKWGMSHSGAMSSSWPVPLSGPPPSSMLTPVVIHTPHQENILPPVHPCPLLPTFPRSLPVRM